MLDIRFSGKKHWNKDTLYCIGNKEKTKFSKEGRMNLQKLDLSD